VVSHFNDQPLPSPTFTQRALEHQVLGFQRFLLDVFSESLEFQTLSCQTTVVHLQIVALQNTHVSRDTHPRDYFHYVAHNDVSSVDGGEFTLSEHSTLGRNVVLEGCHDGGCILFLLETKQ